MNNKVAIKTNIRQKKIIPKKSNVEINREGFHKIYPIQGGVSYVPKCDIRYVDVIPRYKDEQHTQPKDIGWGIQLSFIDGTTILDKTFYKSDSQAEKEADRIVASLPSPTPITTITQNVGGVETNGEAEPSQRIGFNINTDESEEYEDE